MGTSILKGITFGLLVTVLTLIAVFGMTLAGIKENIISYIVDFGLLLSCLAAGYRASSYSGRILSAGLASGGYAIVGVLLLALYFPIEALGAVKTISEGIGLGLLAGVLATGILRTNSDSNNQVKSDVYSKRELYDEKQNLSDNRREIKYGNNPDVERAKIYELCSRNPEKIEEDEAFNWWEIETRRQLKGR